MSTIIGLAGFAQVGKSTASAHIHEVLGEDGKKSQTINFADALRNLARRINPMLTIHRSGNLLDWQTIESMKGYEWLKAETTGRQFLIDLGQGARDLMYSEVWVDTWRLRALKAEGVTVVEDVRYENEARAIKEMGGSVWYIERPGVSAVHDTEAVAIDGILSNGLVDETFLNSESEEAFKSQIEGQLLITVLNALG